MGADDETEPERKYYTLKPKSFERVNRPVHEEPQASLDVHAMLQQNLAADEQRSPRETQKVVPPPLARADPMPPVLPVAPAVSRRKKDFILALICVGVVLAIPAFLLRESELALIGLASALVLSAVLLAWIFWGIMDRY